MSSFRLHFVRNLKRPTCSFRTPTRYVANVPTHTHTQQIRTHENVRKFYRLSLSKRKREGEESSCPRLVPNGRIFRSLLTEKIPETERSVRWFRRTHTQKQQQHTPSRLAQNVCCMFVTFGFGLNGGRGCCDDFNTAFVVWRKEGSYEHRGRV